MVVTMQLIFSLLQMILINIFFFLDREIKIGSKILGKKHNDIWYRGTVVDMSNDVKVAEVDIASESSSVSH